MKKTPATVAELRERGRLSAKQRWGTAALAFLVFALFALSYVPVVIGGIAYEEYIYWKNSENVEVEDEDDVLEEAEPVEADSMSVADGFRIAAGCVWIFSLLAASILIIAGPGIVLIGGAVRVWHAGFWLRRLQGKERPRRTFGQSLKLYGSAVLYSLYIHAENIAGLLICFGVISMTAGIAAFAGDVVVILISVIDILVFLFLMGYFFLLNICYSLTPYFLADGWPTKFKNRMRLIDRLMSGDVWRLIRLRLSYILGILVSILTLGLGFFVVMPRYYAAEAAFYLDLKNRKQRKKCFLLKLFSR